MTLTESLVARTRTKKLTQELF